MYLLGTHYSISGQKSEERYMELEGKQTFYDGLDES